jgi:CBS domain-containing protein
MNDSLLTRVSVHDVMHTGILTTEPSTPLRVVAGLMADQRVHAIAVADPGHARPWGIVTALDVARAAADGEEPTAAQAVRGEVLTLRSNTPLASAAKQMVDRNVSHVVVVDPVSGRPTGFLSALDIAGAYAG